MQLVLVAAQCPSCPRACQQCIHSRCRAPSFFLFKTKTKTNLTLLAQQCIHSCCLAPSFVLFFPSMPFLFSHTFAQRQRQRQRQRQTQRQRQRQKDIDKGHSSCTSSWWLLPSLEWRLPTGWQYIHSCSPFKNKKLQNTTIHFFKWPLLTLHMETKWVKQVVSTTFCFHFSFFAPLLGLNDLFRLFSNHIL